MNKLIGLYSSVPQCGKSTVARYLRDEHNYAVMPFARTLKAMLVPLLTSLGYNEFEVQRLIAHDKQHVVTELGVTVRHLMQTLGTEWGRQCVAPDVWLRVWRKSVERYDRVVVDDVRFPNEADLIKTLGGEMWLVERPGVSREGAAHASEGSLARWRFDRTIVNDRTLHRLYSQLG